MLRKIKDLVGFGIAAKDGDIGLVKDIYDTHKWIGGKKVLIAVKHIQHVEWENSKVAVDLTIDAIKSSEPVDSWEYGVPENDEAEYRKHVVHFKETEVVL